MRRLPAAAFLVCVARRSTDFERHAGGELFPPVEGEARTHDFLELIARHRQVWRHHAGKGTPEPTSIPAGVTTTAVVADTPIHAYPGHCGRAVQVSVTDATPITLQDGWPPALLRATGPRDT